MANGLLTPLQLTAGAALLDNAGIRTYPVAIASYTTFSLIASLQAAINNYIVQPWQTSGTLSQLLSIGAATCPALGNSIPSTAPTPRPIAGPINTGFSGLVKATGDLYLGSGNVAVFAQAFMASQGYVSSVNVFVNSATNAQTYLGPTFKGMDALTTNNISSMNSNFQGFGVDLGRQGNLVNFSNIAYYGTPAGLLRQIANIAGLRGTTLSVIETPMIAAGLTKANIKTLVTGRREDDPLTFDRYQALAYQGMSRVTGASLQQVLNILDVTTPGINTMADLLDQKMIFPNSWKTMSTPIPGGTMLVYLPDGTVDMSLAKNVSTYLPTASGCEELGKIVPPSLAVASKAVQSAYQQITGITETTLPALAETVLGQCLNTWSADTYYLTNDCVSDGATMPTFYRAQQNVPAGTLISDTNYWKPTSLGGLSTMAGLPDIQAQTTAITAATADYYKNNIGTGTGPNGTFNVGDILGAAAGYGYNENFNSVVTNLTELNNIGALGALKTIYDEMQTVSNDSAMLTKIAQANLAISNIASSYSVVVNSLNVAWSAMAIKLNSEYNNQANVGINWDDLPPNNQIIVSGFVQNLPRYGLDVDAGGTGWFLDQVADTAVIGGQAIVGTMREARNNQRLILAHLGVDTKPNAVPAVIPSPVVVPVY